ncbi:MAG: hypothetical protein HXY34_08985 [Candidatus Thorarchaeota archaeon]|nr:hypothetical protein [Candidatus Thorarchaeota archaeon]
MNRVSAFFGFKNPSPELVGISMKMASLLPVTSIAMSLSSSFYIIYIAEALVGGHWLGGMALVGTLIAVQMCIQIMLDYPTGAVGDWIGQRYIILSAFLCMGASFYVLSTVTSHSPVWVVLSVFVLAGIGESQLSGAFQSWFDNNYRIAVPEDVDRSQYGVFWGKVNMLFSLTGTLALVPGSVMAVVVGRAWVFQLQAVLSVLIALIGFFTITDLPAVAMLRERRPSIGRYKTLLGDGVRYLVSSRFVTLIVLGTTVASSVGYVWGSLLLFPMYFSYLGNEVTVSSYRTVLFLIGVVQAERASVLSRRLDPTKWLPRAMMLMGSGFVFFVSFALIMFFLPGTQGDEMVSLTLPFTDVIVFSLPASSVAPTVLILLTFAVSGVFGTLVGILSQRLVVDAIPNRIRNSMYSLIPTISMALAIPQMVFFGWSLTSIGFPFTMASCALVALLGALMVRQGMTYPRPVVSEDSTRSISISQAAPTE